MTTPDTPVCPRCHGDGFDDWAHAALRELVKARAELEATKRAKAENDERFMTERDRARAERDTARAALREVGQEATDNLTVIQLSQALLDGHNKLIAERDSAVAERDTARAALDELVPHFVASAREKRRDAADAGTQKTEAFFLGKADAFEQAANIVKASIERLAAHRRGSDAG